MKKRVVVFFLLIFIFATMVYANPYFDLIKTFINKFGVSSISGNPVLNNNIPTLTLTSVTPTIGETTTSFEFDVTYTDLDNEAPSYIQLVINDGITDTIYPMTKKDTTDINYLDGVIYKSNIKGLKKYKTYTYYVKTSDGIDNVQTSVQQGPTVNNAIPTANIAAGSAVLYNQEFIIDGTVSYDPDSEDSLSYSWQQISGSQVTLQELSPGIVKFVAPFDPSPSTGDKENLVFRLTVTDNDNVQQKSSTMDITVVARDYVNTYYVDNQLTSDCLNANGKHYDPALVRGSGCISGVLGIEAYNTIQKAANVVLAGDTVYIRGGNYNERVTISKSGTSNNHIIISGYNSENVVIDGQNNIGNPNLLLIKKLVSNVVSPVQYLDISKITIANSIQSGVYVVDGQFITLDNLIIQDNRDVGLNLLSSTDFLNLPLGSTHDVTIKNCYIFRNGNVPTHGNPGLKIGAKDAYNVYNVLVENCVIHDNAVGAGHDGDHGDGINPTGNSVNVYDITFRKVVSFHNGASGIGVRMPKNILVEDSIFFDNNINADKQKASGDIDNQTAQGEGYGARFTFNPAQNVNMYGSISFNNLGPGLAFDYMNNAKAYNNLVYRNAELVEFNGIKVDPNGGSIELKNNIAYNNPPVRTGRDIKIDAVAGGAIVDSDYNLIGDGRLPTGEGMHTKSGNPMFNNPPVNGYDLIGVYSNDLVTYDDIYNQLKDKFALASNSPLIDAGVLITGYHCDTSGAHPGENCKEWYGTAPDIGPFEFIGPKSCIIDSDCNDNNICTTDSCVNNLCVNANNNNLCDDNNLCTLNDQCNLGTCSGVLKNCNDNVACTVDSCSFSTGNCANTPDNTLCLSGNTCDTIQGCIPTILTCSQQNGFICSGNEYCPGTILPASDTNSCCSVQCQVQSCGNDILEFGEQCDQGNNNGDNKACRSDCVWNRCGDSLVCSDISSCGVFDSTKLEVCDGNSQICLTTNGYSGTQNCLIDCSGFDNCVTSEYCGDGIKNGNEVCDDGINNGQLGFCSLDCTGFIPPTTTTVFTTTTLPQTTTVFTTTLPQTTTTLPATSTTTSSSSTTVGFISEGTPSGGGGGSGGGRKLPIEVCTEDWTCTNWLACSNNIQQRECVDKNNCGTSLLKPETERSCQPEEVRLKPPVVKEEVRKEASINELSKEEIKLSTKEMMVNKLTNIANSKQALIISMTLVLALSYLVYSIVINRRWIKFKKKLK